MDGRRLLVKEKNPSWRGDEVGDDGLHSWVYSRLGNPRKCSMCGTTQSRYFHWANKSREYKRSNGLKDWIRLCVKCHKKFDHAFIAKGESIGISKLKNHQIINIRKEYSEGNILVKHLARKYKVHLSTLYDVLTRKTWKHILEEEKEEDLGNGAEPIRNISEDDWRKDDR